MIRVTGGHSPRIPVLPGVSRYYRQKDGCPLKASLTLDGCIFGSNDDEIGAWGEKSKMHQGSTNKGFSPLRKSSHNLGAVNRHLDELADAWAIVAKEGGIIDTTIWRKISRCSLAGYMAEEEAELVCT
eukprot:232886-Amorphochlora_amoeboformis.AAC.1